MLIQQEVLEEITRLQQQFSLEELIERLQLFQKQERGQLDQFKPLVLTRHSADEYLKVWLC